MSSEAVIVASDLGKCYQLYANPQDRLKQFLWRGRRQYYREFWALRDASFDIHAGEVIGIVGRNGSGKSTLLQLVCGILTPTVGQVVVKGRIAALLELGAGFNPEFTGRENVFMSAAIMGLSQGEIAERFDGIVEFSGIRDFIDQPVKTYSSGMYVRLAFSVAISVDPDILVIDEALSVGDGEFARKSFDRIMTLKNAGKTILFCSHSLYQIEAICNRAMWLDRGRVAMWDEPARVVTAYNTALMCEPGDADATAKAEPSPAVFEPPAAGVARIDRIEVTADGRAGRRLAVRSGETDIVIRVEFTSDRNLPPPTLAVSIVTKSGHVVTSAGSLFDGATLARRPDGRGVGEIRYPRIPLLKGDYTISVFLACERMLHMYDYVERYAELVVEQRGLEQGVAALPHEWRDVLQGSE